MDASVRSETPWWLASPDRRSAPERPPLDALDQVALLASALYAVSGHVHGLQQQVDALLFRLAAPPPPRSYAPGYRPASSAFPRTKAPDVPPVPAPVGAAAAIRAGRLRLGLSQQALARTAHCSRGLLAGVERGARRNPHTLRDLLAVVERLEAARRAKEVA